MEKFIFFVIFAITFIGIHGMPHKRNDVTTTTAPPYYFKSMPDPIFVQANGTVRIRCLRVEGGCAEKSYFEHKFNSKPLNVHNKKYNFENVPPASAYTYQIKNVGFSDSGTYSCYQRSSICNNIGLEKHIRVIVQDEPKAPLITSLTCHRSNKTTLTWKNTGGNNSPVSKYTIHSNSSSETREFNVSNSQTSYEFTNLKPGKQHEFHVQAWNDIGPSELSKLAICSSRSPSARIPINSSLRNPSTSGARKSSSLQPGADSNTLSHSNTRRLDTATSNTNPFDAASNINLKSNTTQGNTGLNNNRRFDTDYGTFKQRSNQTSTGSNTFPQSKTHQVNTLSTGQVDTGSNTFERSIHHPTNTAFNRFLQSNIDQLDTDSDTFEPSNTNEGNAGFNTNQFSTYSDTLERLKTKRSSADGSNTLSRSNTNRLDTYSDTLKPSKTKQTNTRLSIFSQSKTDEGNTGLKTDRFNNYTGTLERLKNKRPSNTESNTFQRNTGLNTDRFHTSSDTLKPPINKPTNATDSNTLKQSNTKPIETISSKTYAQLHIVTNTIYRTNGNNNTSQTVFADRANSSRNNFP